MEDDYKSISTSKIQNGYLINESGCDNGKYYSKQTYVAEKPTLGVTDASASASVQNSMQKAMAYMNRAAPGVSAGRGKKK